MDERGIVAASRIVRSVLDDLVGPAAAPGMDAEIGRLLSDVGRRPGAASDLQDLLNSQDGTSSFLEGVLDDAPRYRPPEYQASSTRSVDRATYKGLDGDGTVVLHAGKFSCPHGDFDWYRPGVDADIISCKSHGSPLLPVTGPNE